MQHEIPTWVYLVISGVTAGAVLLQALVLVGMLVALKGALGRLNEVSKKAEEKVLPLLATSRSLLEEVSPKLRVAAQNALEISQTAREISVTAREMSQTAKTESTRVAAALDDMLQKAAVQADRVDEIVTGTLDSVVHATATLQKAVSGPVRQVNAVLNGLKAGFDVLRSKEREAHAAADGDHFV
jgi:flagellar biosynthesis chaperone FliJ